jgi:ATP-binding cassette, subfamily G (WHITE), member 2, PDR
MQEIEEIHMRLRNVQSAAEQSEDHGAFAMPFKAQLRAVTIRTFQHYYRSPVYIGGKFILNVLASLFIGFTFYMTDNTVQGFQNKLFAVFFTVPNFLFCIPDSQDNHRNSLDKSNTASFLLFARFVRDSRASK